MNKDEFTSFVILSAMTFLGVIMGIYLLDSLFDFCPRQPSNQQVYQQQY
jgi:hypothetical protein